jgi:autotransporter passenger strand-loop-strand repeat protein
MLTITNTGHGIADSAPFPRDLRMLGADYLEDQSDRNSITGVYLNDRLYDQGVPQAPGRAPADEGDQQGGAGPQSRQITSSLSDITNPASIGAVDLAPIALNAPWTTPQTAIPLVPPPDRGGIYLAATQDQPTVSDTFSGSMIISGSVTATNGSQKSSETFSGTIGVYIIADINSNGTGEIQQLSGGYINVHYVTPSGSHDATKIFNINTSQFPMTNGSFSYDYKTIFFGLGVNATITLAGSANASLTQISESMDVPLNGNYLGVPYSGAMKGSATLTGPALTINGAGSSNTVDTFSVQPFTKVVIEDFNAGQTVSVTVTMSNPANGTLSNLGGGSFDASTGIFKIQGSSQAVTTALDGLEFNPTPHQGPAGDVITTSFTISASDGAGGSATNSATTVSTTETAALPVLAGGGNSVNYQPGGAAVIVDSQIVLTDAGSTTLDGASVFIGSGLGKGDILGFTNQNNISGSYNASKGVLTLSGTDSLANYQAALQSITFSSTSPEPSAAGTDLQRTIYWSVTAAAQQSNFVDSTVVIGIPTIVSYGETQIVSAGTTAYETVVLNGGAEIVESRGRAFGTTISSGGEIVFDGGITGGLSLRAGSLEGVAPGQTASGLSVAFGIGLLVSSGAVASGTNLTLGGFENVLPDGTVIGNSIGAMGTISVSSGATASATSISSGGTEKVLTGGVDSASQVSSGGALVSVYGQVSNTTVFAGGVADLFAGSSTDATLSGGHLLVLNGAVASGADVEAGGSALAGEFAGGTVGGTIDDSMVSSGGIIVAGAGAVVSGGTIQGGATLFQLAGVTSNVDLSGSQLVATTLFGSAQPAVASATTVESGGLLTINADGSTVDSTILGGEILVSSGGVADGVMVSSGGTMVSIYGEISNTTIFAGGLVDQFVGSSEDTTLSGGHLLVLNGAVTSVVDVEAGGLALAGEYAGGAVGGTIDDATASSGGLVVLGTLSVLSGATIQSGGTLFELAGQASNVALAGLEYVGGGLPGVAPPNPPPPAVGTDTTVSSGGMQVVNSNGSAVDTNVLSGGEIVFNGGLVSGLSVASGGIIDLLGFSFSSATSLTFVENVHNTGGTLTVSSGIDTMSINLLGQYVAGGFQDSPDGGTGTLVTYTGSASSNVELAGHPGAR